MARAFPTVNLEELDRVGFTVVRALLPRNLTAALRQCTDVLLERRAELARQREEVVGEAARSTGPTHDLRNLALYGKDQVDVLASAIAESDSLRVACQLSKCNLEEQQLQLIEQVLIKTDPSSSEHHGPHSFHLDWIFLREHYDAVPRQTYFHMVTYLCDVAPGQAAFTILPGSHHKTYAAASQLCSHAELQRYRGKLGQSGGPFAALKQDPVKVAGLDPSSAVEVTGSEGDCVICEPAKILHVQTIFSDRPELTSSIALFCDQLYRSQPDVSPLRLNESNNCPSLRLLSVVL